MRFSSFRRFASLILVLTMLVTCVSALSEGWTCLSCGHAADGNFCSNCGARHAVDVPDAFYDIALKGASLMQECCGDRMYLSLMLPSEQEVIDTVTGLFPEKVNAASPVQALGFYFRDDDFASILPVIGALADQQLPNLNMFKYRPGSQSSYLISFLNNSYGVEWLLAAQMATVSGSTLVADVEPGSALMLLDYGEDAGAMAAVSIYVNEEGIAVWSASPLRMEEQTRTMLFSIADTGLSSLLSSLSPEESAVIIYLTSLLQSRLW